MKAPSRETLKTLFETIGGRPAVESILEIFYQKMSEDILIGYFFSGKDLIRIAHQQATFLLMASGLETEFKGKGPASAHTEMPPIYEGHFDRRLVLLRETLTKQGLSLEQVNTWVQLEESFRLMIVSKEHG